MANKTLFQSPAGKIAPAVDAINEAGAPAYALPPKQALAQYVATGCLQRTFYAGAEDQLAKVLALCAQVEPEFIARAAIYARERGLMKDTPALLCAILSVKNKELFTAVFARVIDNGRMLRNFVQIMRSGTIGRKSLGSAPKRLVREWLDARDDDALFRSSVGQSPSFADIIKMVHPKPKDASRAALYGYLLGGEYDRDALPALVREFEAYKNADSGAMAPPVPFELLTALDLGTSGWTEVARRASWQMTRMNLNTFARHGVFEQDGLPELIAERLRDAAQIARARVFPYQLLAAYASADEGVPATVRDALHDALEIATQNVPAFFGKVYVCPDVSGSMLSAATGHRPGATSKVRCIDVAALVAASVVRRNPLAEVLPFEEQVVKVTVDARDSVLTNARRLAATGGGGTNCSAPLALLNRKKAVGDLVVFVSDYESWVDARGGGRGTAMMDEWAKFKRRNPHARLVCINIQPYATAQAPVEREDILHVGGFSDRVFEVVADFAANRLKGERWVRVIEAINV